MPSISASALRADIYRIIERVARTGEPVDVTSKGRRVRIVPVDNPPSRLDALMAHPDAADGDLDDFVHLNWSDEWRPRRPRDGCALVTPQRRHRADDGGDTV